MEARTRINSDSITMALLINSTSSRPTLATAGLRQASNRITDSLRMVVTSSTLPLLRATAANSSHTAHQATMHEDTHPLPTSHCLAMEACRTSLAFRSPASSRSFPPWLSHSPK
jgi:hypothetical protein